MGAVNSPTDDILDSELSNTQKLALIDVRNYLAVYRLFRETRDSDAKGLEFREALLEFKGTLRNAIEAAGSDMNNMAGEKKAAGRHPSQPSPDRQSDILATIKDADTPLTRSEIVSRMRLIAEGKLGANLAWMVKNHILIKIQHRGYWPADLPVPEE